MPDHPLVLDDELRADALDVLRDAESWVLPEERWSAVSGAVAVMAAAAHDGDADAFREAVYDLELAGPVRAVGADEVPIVSASEQVRVEIGRLSRVVENSAEPERG